jgi:hypothetical protein
VTHALDLSDRATSDARSQAVRPRAPEAERKVYRLGDLDRRGRWVAVAFALALCVAPLQAFAWAVPDWAPAGDPALMGLRALDVGTSRTPLIGQPSSSAAYVDGDRPVYHPGATHFYLLAGPVRLFGGIGMVFVSVVIAGGCILIAAWAVLRQLGASAGAIAAVLLGAITFTTGASSLIDPVSSRISGYPLLCSAVLLWCVLCGDLRLLPLTTAVVSFTAQQHLSVGPAVVVLTAGAVIGLVATIVIQRRWRDQQVRHRLVHAGGWSALVALVMWAPVLVDQLARDGNLGHLMSYIRSGDRDTVGITSGVHQVVHTLGLPPLLGQTDFSGQWLLAQPSFFTWLSALGVVAVVAALGVHWWRTSHRKSGLAIMAGLAALAGLANGSSVPGFERGRPAFYHWSFVLAFLAFLVIGIGVLDFIRNRSFGRQSFVIPALTAVVLAAIVIPSAVNPALDRRTNSLADIQSFWRSRRFDRLSDAVMAHRDELGRQTALIGGGGQFVAFREALAFSLAERGLEVRHPRALRGFVDDDRLVDASTVTSGLVLQPFGREGGGRAVPGELLAVIRLKRGSDVSAPFAFGVAGFRLYLLDRDQLLEVAKVIEL